MASKKCLVCNMQQAKYKCPTCLIPFCSVSCSRTHKQVECQPPQPPSSSQLVLPVSVVEKLYPNAEAGEFVDKDTLKHLDGNVEVWRKWKHPHVRAAMLRLSEAKDRTVALHKEMQDPGFLEFCDDILEALGYKDDE